MWFKANLISRWPHPARVTAPSRASVHGGALGVAMDGGANALAVVCGLSMGSRSGCQLCFRGQYLPLPVNGQPQAFFQMDSWRETQHGGRLGDVGNPAQNVFVFAAGNILVRNKFNLGAASFSSQFVNHVGKLENRDFAGIADVEDFAGRPIFKDPLQAVDGVADIGKAAGLAAIAVNGKTLALQDCTDEYRLRAAPPA